MNMEATAYSSRLETLSLSSHRRRATEELIKGRETALQLRKLIQKSTKNEGLQVIINQDLVANILSSITNSLSILKNGESDEVSQDQAHTQLGSPNWEAYLNLDDSGQTSNSSTIKVRRGCHKRRKCAESWTQHSSMLIDDGHAWRKYGQKLISNAKFQRNYFRCTYKSDQGCQATKAVERIEEEPPVYRTTYYGNHTCKNLLKASQLIPDSTASDAQRPKIISFGSAHVTEKDINPFLSSFPTMNVKKSKKDQTPSDMTHTHSQSSPSDDYRVSPEFTAIESTGEHMTTLSSDHGDVISGANSSCTATASAHSLDMPVDFVDGWEFALDNVLEFGFEA